MIFIVCGILAIYIVSSSVIQYLVVDIFNTILPQVHHCRIAVKGGNKLKCHFRILTVAGNTCIIEAYVNGGIAAFREISKIHNIAFTSVGSLSLYKQSRLYGRSVAECISGLHHGTGTLCICSRIRPVRKLS